jgi:hypothetical protein
MLLWILLLGGLALAAGAMGLILAMGHAERRARRTLFRALGLPEDTVDLLMARDGDVLAELALVRRHDLTDPSGADLPPAEPAATRLPPSIRLVHPTTSGQAATSLPPPADTVRPAGDRRRLHLPGRQGRS